MGTPSRRLLYAAVPSLIVLSGLLWLLTSTGDPATAQRERFPPDLTPGSTVCHNFERGGLLEASSISYLCAGYQLSRAPGAGEHVPPEPRDTAAERREMGVDALDACRFGRRCLGAERQGSRRKRRVTRAQVRFSSRPIHRERVPRSGRGPRLDRGNRAFRTPGQLAA